MWPFGHAAVGYLLYAAYCRYRDGRPPSGPDVLAVLFGTQLPDLVDKPLAWTVAVLPTGRTLAHSWLVAAVVLGVAWWYLGPSRRALLPPLAVGWLSHGLADGFSSFLAWEPAYLGFLLWPLTSTPPYDTEPSFAAHLLGVELTPHFYFQWGLALIALLVWHRDGHPGLGTVRSAVDIVAARLPG